MFTGGLIATADREMRLCHESKTGDSWHRSHFGSQPRMLVAAQHSGVALLDLRVSRSCVQCKSFSTVDSLSAEMVNFGT